MQQLLQCSDVPPVETLNAAGAGRLLLTGDHAGNLVPHALGDLGVSDADRARHIGWDIGVEALGRALSARLNATFVRQRYSRLVIDCNRDPASAEATPESSDGTSIPGNIGLNATARAARVAEIHTPYQAAIAAALATRPPGDALIALHSFTPRMNGIDRPWHIGVLHNGHNDALAHRVLAWLHANAGRPIGDNEPYRMDATDHTVPRHAFTTHRPYLEIEVRQDLLATAAGIEAMAALLARAMGAGGSAEW